MRYEALSTTSMKDDAAGGAEKAVLHRHLSLLNALPCACMVRHGCRPPVRNETP